MSKDREGRWLTNVAIANNVGHITQLHTRNCKYIRVWGDMTTDLSNLTMVGADSVDSTTWTKLGPVTKTDKHLDGDSFITGKFDLTGFLEYPPSVLRIGNISGTAAAGLNLWYKIGF